MSDREAGEVHGRAAASAASAGEGAAAERPAGVRLGPLAEIAGFMLRLGQLRLFEIFYADFGAEGIRPGEISILVAIGENPAIRQGVLADALSIKWSNMAKIVRQLEEDGLIERRVPPADRRAIELHLTSTGRDLVERMVPRLIASDTRSTAPLTAAERATLLGLLAKLDGHGRAEGPGRC